MKYRFVSKNIDFVGFTTSTICAVHCVALPFILSIAPLTSLQFLNDPLVEYGFITASLVIATYALLSGYRKHHRKLNAVYLMIIGFMLIGTGHLFVSEWVEISFSTFGASIVAISHFINWRDIRRSNSNCNL